MYILGIIERQMERLQEVSADADYSQLMAVDALETEIKVSEEIRKLICMHNEISQKVEEQKVKIDGNRICENIKNSIRSIDDEYKKKGK